MKKFLVTILCVVMVLPIISCGSIVENGKTAETESSSLPTSTNNQQILPMKTREVPEGIPETAKNMFYDDMFQCGLMSCGRNVDIETECGCLNYDGIANYSNRKWYLSQWYTRQTLGYRGNSGEDYAINYTREGNVHKYSNDAKNVSIDIDSGAITLGVNTKYEYNNKERPVQSEWVHLLLINNALNDRYSLRDLSGLYAYVDYSINKADFADLSGEKLKFGISEQRTQLVWYLVIQSGETYEKDGQTYHYEIWFGIPLYDSYVSETTPYVIGEVMSFDLATNMGLYSMAVDEYMTDGYVKADKANHRFVINLDEYTKICFNNAVQSGLFPKESSFDDAHIYFSNIGWEVTGTCECETTINAMGVYYDYKK